MAIVDDAVFLLLFIYNWGTIFWLCLPSFHSVFLTATLSCYQSPCTTKTPGPCVVSLKRFHFHICHLLLPWLNIYSYLLWPSWRQPASHSHDTFKVPLVNVALLIPNSDYITVYVDPPVAPPLMSNLSLFSKSLLLSASNSTLVWSWFHYQLWCQ